MASAQPKQSNILTLMISELEELRAAYMPFLPGGGLFVPTTRNYNLGDEIFLRLMLIDETDVLPVPGQVVWVTPAQAQDNREQGIGIQFTDNDETVRTRIEAHLGGLLGSESPTNTM